MGTGLRTAAPGGRQVLDRNYFLNELRQKRSEIADEIARMGEQVAAAEARQAATAKAEKRFNELRSEVKGLTESLADYNTVLDKASCGRLHAVCAVLGSCRFHGCPMAQLLQSVVTRQSSSELAAAEQRLV